MKYQIRMTPFESIQVIREDGYPKVKELLVAEFPKPTYYSDYDKPLSNLYKDYDPKPRNNQGVLREVCPA